MLFGGTHLGLASRRVRGALVGRLGEAGFTRLFSAVAAGSFALLVVGYAAYRLVGPPGPGLGAVGALRTPLVVSVVLGIVLMAAAFESYPRAPMAIGARPEKFREPRGIERVTRHPFFVGLVLFALPHAALATRLVGTLFAAGFVLLAAVGARRQDRKLLARHGAPYARYLAATSGVPFAAILSGRQRLVWRELPFASLAIGCVLAAALRTLHEGIFAWGGAFVILVVVGGAALLAPQALLRPRRAVSLADHGA
jgi:uncharacterized membrane protein